MMVACILSGLSGLFAPSESSAAIQRLLPKAVELGWYLGLIIGGVIGLYGLVKNLLVERIGMTILTSISFGYLLVLINVSPRLLTFSLFIILFFSLACLIRIIQVNRLLKREAK
jgi:ABC-type microcin C transport system permease subunit YejE